MENILIWFEKKNLKHMLQLAVYASVHIECIIELSYVRREASRIFIAKQEISEADYRHTG